MTSDGPTTPDPVEQDDRLLDAISRGAPPPPDHPADDPIAALLTGWHADVLARSQHLESTLQLTPVGPAAHDAPASPSTVAAAPIHGTAARRDRSARSPGDDLTRRLRWRPRHKAYTGAMLALVTITSGVWLGAARAQPGELMWPVTRLVHADRAEALITEREIVRTLDQVRQDLASGQHADARYHLERAAALLDAINDHETAVRLRNDIEQLRQQLPAPAPEAPTSPSAPDAYVPTDLPAPSLTVPATPAATQPTGTDPEPAADTSIQSPPALPSAEPTDLPRPTRPARPNVQPTAPQPQPSAARTSTAETDVHQQAPPARPPRPRQG
ncbi:hypothetical protein HCJ94_26995 [Micromonospora sp. HSS6-12]|uniref:Anti-sigma-D factor RsdA sigma factor binding region domain-containing protein n=1 Tax=Micromonospora thermarum TaxID=2720024 RepID=A0ABX0ZC75_9ACTN|nr:hypothetical protein [Micromonospora thermarum]